MVVLSIDVFAPHLHRWNETAVWSRMDLANASSSLRGTIASDLMQDSPIGSWQTGQCAGWVVMAFLCAPILPKAPSQRRRPAFPKVASGSCSVSRRQRTPRPAQRAPSVPCLSRSRNPPCDDPPLLRLRQTFKHNADFDRVVKRRFDRARSKKIARLLPTAERNRLVARDSLDRPL